MCVIPVINREDYTVSVEKHANALWIHCDVRRFTKDTLKDMNKTWPMFINLIDSDLYVLRSSSNQVPSINFISKYGFFKFKDILDKQGNHKEIWKRNKDGRRSQ